MVGLGRPEQCNRHPLNGHFRPLSTIMAAYTDTTMTPRSTPSISTTAYTLASTTHSHTVTATSVSSPAASSVFSDKRGSKERKAITMIKAGSALANSFFVFFSQDREQKGFSSLWLS